jgi:hypothetical protein
LPRGIDADQVPAWRAGYSLDPRLSKALQPWMGSGEIAI